MKRRDVYDERGFHPKPAEPLDGLWGVCDSPSIPVPSVPVDSSEAGAAKAQPSVKTQCNAILVELRAAGCIPDSGKYLSRCDLSARLGIAEHALCGRLGPSGPLLTPEGSEAGPWALTSKDAACVSTSGVRVKGYQLSKSGVIEADRLAKRRAA
jgi:hypothetical protein